ncbi:MAG TPA: hypothetical protein VGK45_13130, partial [Thermoanaerobaculia bacterium]
LMRHLEVAEIAKLLSEGSPFGELCRHLAETCPTCGERLAEVEALLSRFRHWDAETVVREGPAAAELLDTLLAKGEDCAAWCSAMKEDGEYQTWCVAWIALERAQSLIAEDDGARSAQGRDLALLAAAITDHLGASYHPNSVSDLKALAYATAAAAGSPAAVTDTLRQVAAAVAALDQGTGDPTVARDVMDLLSRVFRKAAE